MCDGRSLSRSVGARESSNEHFCSSKENGQTYAEEQPTIICFCVCMLFQMFVSKWVPDYACFEIVFNMFCLRTLVDASASLCKLVQACTGKDGRADERARRRAVGPPGGRANGRASSRAAGRPLRRSASRAMAARTAVPYAVGRGGGSSNEQVSINGHTDTLHPVLCSLEVREG